MTFLELVLEIDKLSTKQQNEEVLIEVDGCFHPLSLTVADDTITDEATDDLVLTEGQAYLRADV
jgi:hypothetical protein